MPLEAPRATQEQEQMMCRWEPGEKLELMPGTNSGLTGERTGGRAEWREAVEGEKGLNG